MGFWKDLYDAECNGWSVSSERANKRNIERGRIAQAKEMLELKRREVDALEELTKRTRVTKLTI